VLHQVPSSHAVGPVVPSRVRLPTFVEGDHLNNRLDHPHIVNLPKSSAPISIETGTGGGGCNSISTKSAA
jgi:hypothetical protein